jgi:hypothetical protein
MDTSVDDTSSWHQYLPSLFTCESSPKRSEEEYRRGPFCTSILMDDVSPVDSLLDGDVHRGNYCSYTDPGKDTYFGVLFWQVAVPCEFTQRKQDPPSHIYTVSPHTNTRPPSKYHRMIHIEQGNDILEFFLWQLAISPGSLSPLYC